MAAALRLRDRAPSVITRGTQPARSLAPRSVFLAVYTKVNARLASEALRLGGGEGMFLNGDEARMAAETKAAQIGWPWELWKAKVLAKPR